MQFKPLPHISTFVMEYEKKKPWACKSRSLFEGKQKELLEEIQAHGGRHFWYQIAKFDPS